MSEQTPLNINEKNKILKINDVIVENFSSDSSSKEVEQGASPKYNWGLPDNYNSNDKVKQKNNPELFTTGKICQINLKENSLNSAK